ncbi:hypothetical protein [Methanococcoides sp. AM1]|uniref:hypothetical protein n=1 Tax=Methanococcoides sp. AM1 TaxID=1201011 RepID=UPI0010824032|nr:hypothetical protein [Methanococcoides sp. AM1]
MQDMSHQKYKFVFYEGQFVLYGNSVSDLWNDIYDAFDLYPEMYVERTNGKEMKQREIRELREEIFEDMEEDVLRLSSEYRNKKLYFFNEGDLFVGNRDELIKNMKTLFEEMFFWIVDDAKNDVFCDFLVEN